MMVVMVVFWAAIILGIVWLIASARRGWPLSTEAAVTRERPVDILERRFAEGEISIEEYQARREALVNGAAEPSDEDEKQLTASGAGEGRE